MNRLATHFFIIFARRKVNISAVHSETPIYESTEKRPSYTGKMFFVRVDIEEQDSCEHVFGFL